MRSRDPGRVCDVDQSPELFGGSRLDEAVDPLGVARLVRPVPGFHGPQQGHSVAIHTESHQDLLEVGAGGLGIPIGRMPARARSIGNGTGHGPGGRITVSVK
jgi:hypothetical protein